jgi:hypothetical protein
MNRPAYQLALIAPVLLIACSPGYQEVRGLIKNPGFEQGRVGEAPDGWLNGGGSAGYPAEVSGQNPQNGLQCGLLYTDPRSRVRDYGSLSQMIDTATLRNKALRLSIFAKATTVQTGWAAVFYRVDRIGDQKPLYMNLRIVGKEWHRYDLFLRVPPDAIRMQFGVTLSGEGRLWVDDAS